MFAIKPSMRIFVAVDPIDFRYGMDYLIKIIKSLFKEDPKSGILFLFKNKNNTGVKILTYDGTGFWLCYKRLTDGKLDWWPKADRKGKQNRKAVVDKKEFLALIKGSYPEKKVVKKAA